MTIRQFCSQLFDYRIKDGESGWDEAAQQLSRNGTWSITGSPKKFQEIIIELCKRIEKLEEHDDRHLPTV
mgnify:CR=1 FL=1